MNDYGLLLQMYRELLFDPSDRCDVTELMLDLSIEENQ